MQALGRRPDARARHKGGQNPFADDPASCHLLRSSIALPYGAHWPLPAKASSQRKGSQRAPRQNLTVGALWNASGASAMWVKRPLAGEIAGAPATSDPGYRECCTVLSVLRARVAGAEVRIAGQLAQLWMSGGPPVSKSIAIVFEGRGSLY